MESPSSIAAGPVARIGIAPTLTAYLIDSPADPLRQRAEAFIRDSFARHYQARIRYFMPELMVLQDAHGEIQGVAGMRRAGQSGLFLEQYLDAPIETALQQPGRQPVLRDGVAEVGNLATTNAASARQLITAFTDYLHRIGIHWVTFTGTPLLLNSFRRLGIEMLKLGQAHPERLGAEQHDWGSYYACQPSVMAGNVDQGYWCLQQSGTFAALHYQPIPSMESIQHAVS